LIILKYFVSLSCQLLSHLLFKPYAEQNEHSSTKIISIICKLKNIIHILWVGKMIVKKIFHFRSIYMILISLWIMKYRGHTRIRNNLLLYFIFQLMKNHIESDEILPIIISRSVNFAALIIVIIIILKIIYFVILNFGFSMNAVAYLMARVAFSTKLTILYVGTSSVCCFTEFVIHLSLRIIFLL